MDRFLVSAVLVAGLFVVGGPAAAHDSVSPRQASEHPLLVAAGDDAHDLRITGNKGLSENDRRSVELTRLEVTDRGPRVRFDLRLARVDRSEEFTQITLLNVTSAELPWSQAMIATHSTTEPPDGHGIEHRQVIEGAQGRQGFVSCDHLPIRLRDGARRLWVEIPKRCLPRGAVSIEVCAQTIDPPTHQSNAQWSWDRLEVPGVHDLGGRARPGTD